MESQRESGPEHLLVMEPVTERNLIPSHLLAPYVAMAEQFVAGRIDAPEFEERFWQEFQGRELPAAARTFLDACRVR